MTTSLYVCPVYLSWNKPVEQCTSLYSKAGPISEDTCHVWRGDTGTSEMNYQQMMDYSLKDRGWSYQVSFTRSTCNVYTKAISLQIRYRKMPKNTCTGLESMLTLRTTLRDARNVSSSLRLPMSPSSLMTYQRARGGNLAWIIFTLMAILMS